MAATPDFIGEESYKNRPTASSNATHEIELEGIEDDDAEDNYPGIKSPGFTRNDRKDMDRMGKVQELRRNFRPISALAFVVMLQSTWEILLTATTQGLIDGGLAGLFWSYVWTFLGIMLVVISLAEMASMAPTSGGQYHWVSEFAPPRHQRFLSYITGWMSTLSWQAGTAAGPFLVGTIIQALVTVNDENYVPKGWQGTLMVWAVTIGVFVLNIWGAKIMPMIQNIMLGVHVFGFLAVILTLWILSPRNSAETVFTHFSNEGGWSSTGLSLMVGQISAIYGLICSDAAAHLSEEIKDAAVTVPRAMVGSYILNGLLGLVFLISFLFCITDVDAALDDPSFYPFLWVFKNTVNMAGVNGLSALIIILLFAGTVPLNLSTSRQTWSFARDNGLPFSKWIAYVHPGLQVPTNAVALSCIVIVLLSLINIGSDVAFNAIISLNLVALMFTYCISIGCVLYRRIAHPEMLPKARWSLGRWGVPINVGGMLYSFFAFFWCFWPNSIPVNAENFNWSVVMFMGVLIFSLFYYAIVGRHVYTGPVVLVKGYRS